MVVSRGFDSDKNIANLLHIRLVATISAEAFLFSDFSELSSPV